MDLSLLRSVYAPKDFKAKGRETIDLISAHLYNNLSEISKTVIPWKNPEEAHTFWEEFLKNGDINTFQKLVLEQSTSIHHPKYIGHQVAPTAPITIVSGMLSAFLNNGMAIYEMGMVANPIERIITDLLCAKIGYDTAASGFLTSGGTLANLTALLAARAAKAPTDIWNNGNTIQLGVMVSEEAHYCIERAVKIMGLGEKGIIKIPSTSTFQLDTSLLQEYYDNALADGIIPFAIVGSAPCTATGMFDDLEVIGSFAKKNDIWFHADGAHGGAAIFSPTYVHTLKGIEKADTVIIDGHKMMMMPGITTAILFKNNNNSYSTFSQKADYLLDQSNDQDWYNSGKRTFECTKNMMCLHWFTLLKTYGEQVFDDFVTCLYNKGKEFAQMILDEDHFELAVQPMSNIVCFRYIEKGLSPQQLDELNQAIRQQILEDGNFYIVQTKLKGTHYLRVTIMNPFTTKEHLKELVALVKQKAGLLNN